MQRPAPPPFASDHRTPHRTIPGHDTLTGSVLVGGWLIACKNLVFWPEVYCERGDKVRRLTLANLTGGEPRRIEALRRALKGEFDGLVGSTDDKTLDQRVDQAIASPPCGRRDISTLG
jgi:hypothetical protein